MSKEIIDEFQNVINYKFKNVNLLLEALTHSSYANEHQLKSNERLEFLGDAVLELAMSKHLFSIIDLDEGVLTKTRDKSVCEEALDLYANKINLSKYLFLGKGEESSGGRTRKAILADAFEAVLGAIFLDSGFENAYSIVECYVLPYYNSILKIKDYKSLLQEKLQSEKRSIHYEIVRDEGPANNKTFEAVVYMDNILMGRGIGKSKKQAEQEAAKNALAKEAKN